MQYRNTIFFAVIMAAATSSAPASAEILASATTPLNIRIDNRTRAPGRAPRLQDAFHHFAVQIDRCDRRIALGRPSPVASKAAAYINNQPVLVQPSTRQVEYIYR